MTQRELAVLRDQVVRARVADEEARALEQRLLRDAMWPKRRRFTGRCGYCGSRCFGRTCASHRDLPQLEAAVR